MQSAKGSAAHRAALRDVALGPAPGRCLAVVDLGRKLERAQRLKG